jgi:hypothetical protein
VLEARVDCHTRSARWVRRAGRTVAWAYIP